MINNRKIEEKKKLKDLIKEPKINNQLIKLLKAKNLRIKLKIIIFLSIFLFQLLNLKIFFKFRISNIQKIITNLKNKKVKSILHNFLISSDIIKIKGAKTTGEHYSWFNPSIINYNSLFLVTIRDSNYHNCPNKEERIRVAKNKIIFGVGESLYNLTFAGMIDSHNISKSIYLGLEDARLFTYDNNTKIGMTATNNYEMFISRLELSTNEKHEYIITEMTRNKINHSSFMNSKPQKNWVRFPDEEFGEDPRFICNLNPLIIISINVESGIPNLIFKGNKENNIHFEIRGSTNFLKISSELYIGICHTKIIGHYYSIFIKIEKDNNKFKIEIISNIFKAPIFNKNLLISDQYIIHFPLSILCYDKLNCSRILVSLGIMDCLPYFALYNSSNIFDHLLKKII